MPAITAIVAISLVWGYLYNTQFGLFNYLLSLVGLPPVQWLSDPMRREVLGRARRRLARHRA